MVHTTGETETEKLIQNLKDAGCNQSEIRQFMAEVESGKTKQALKLLDGHRKLLLDQFHKSKNSIDCLDYLIFRMEQENLSQKNN